MYYPPLPISGFILGAQNIQKKKNGHSMLRRDIVRPSGSFWSSSVVVIREIGSSVLFCVDYRALNKMTRKDVYPKPRIDDALNT